MHTIEQGIQVTDFFQVNKITLRTTKLRMVEIGELNQPLNVGLRQDWSWLSNDKMTSDGGQAVIGGHIMQNIDTSFHLRSSSELLR